ncbi:MAG: beta-propeller fold lactonase family protein [Phycisphaerae bacterium]|nr:beta-propeller fold lactonase family protein [Phycisphaerae bacterium]
MLKSLALIVPGLIACSVWAQPLQRTLFVTNNVGSPGSVTSFRVRADGTLDLAGVFSNVGVNPQDCGLTADGSRLVVLNATASVTTEDLYTARVNGDGTIVVNPVPNTVGDGPLALFITSNDYLLVPSATLDNVTSYRVNFNNLTPISQAFAGTFPTKTIATPDNKFAYSIGSASPNDVVHFTLDPGGVLSFVSGTDIAGGGGFGAAMHPSGDTLYVSTGLQNLILRYSVNINTGAITLAGSHSSGGAPNNSAVEIAIHPSGEWLYVCHVVSDTLSVLRVNADRSLSTTGFMYDIGNDLRDVVTDGEFVYVTDESTLEPGVGVLVYRVQADGSLVLVSGPTPTGGTRPQFMAIFNRPAPGAFALVSPAEGATGVSTTPTLAWQSSSGAVSYHVVVDDESAFVPPHAFESTTAMTSVSIGGPGLNEGATYFWRVTAVSGFGESIGSPNPGTFTTALPPPACYGDANGDWVVDFADITATLAQWGGAGPLGDATGDGEVDFMDITAEVANWGICPSLR